MGLRPWDDVESADLSPLLELLVYFALQSPIPPMVF